ncbi:hypothetical protein DHEL01_v205642 [Diaporthe helianthi]|uniref:Aminoglycoside phosphotransferase domain-containing protein n=1 Tax=Diaporthe helianthi TaxID=158607 RepID=A0A2P5I0F6_DIAHE|nr:hypothetical protein DHEL01_v205642 [Diaporthe helianthi]
MAPEQDRGGQPSTKRQLAMSWNKDDLISTFKQTPQLKPDGFAVTGFVFPPVHPVAYVKFGLLSERRAELRNHEYAFKALKAMPQNQTQGIIIPEVYRSFEYGERLFIIMEYIPGRTLEQLVQQPGWESQQPSVSNEIARAIKLLMSIKPPPGQKPGPVRGGQIRHPLFKDNTSYLEYNSIDELEEHLNKVSTLRFKDSPTVRLERKLCFYYSDFFAGNFIFTDSGDLCIIDFDQAGFLPESFMMFALADSSWYPALWIKDILGLPQDNLEAMRNMFYWFTIGVAYIGKLQNPSAL